MLEIIIFAVIFTYMHIRIMCQYDDVVDILSENFRLYAEKNKHDDPDIVDPYAVACHGPIR